MLKLFQCLVQCVVDTYLVYISSWKILIAKRLNTEGVTWTKVEGSKWEGGKELTTPNDNSGFFLGNKTDSPRKAALFHPLCRFWHPIMVFSPRDLAFNGSLCWAPSFLSFGSFSFVEKLYSRCLFIQGLRIVLINCTNAECKDNGIADIELLVLV